MRIKKLQVSNLRVFEQAEFEFRPGMNLLVGVNGVGKTTVLDALRICLSKILPKITSSRNRPLPFTHEDIRANSGTLTINCTFELQELEYTLLIHKQREGSVSFKPGEVREQVLDTPDIEEYWPKFPAVFTKSKEGHKQPLGLFFSIRRSLVSDISPSKTKAAGGQAGAFADALASRELRLAELAYWMRAQEDLGGEHALGLKHLSALRQAAKRFLPDCESLRAETSPKPRLIIQKQRITLDVRQLSAGERGLLALVLDLARRLSQANPKLADPVKEGSAVVLIDELDLHLHPKWQRTIVEALTSTFSSCQFIATTHSPQIVAAVEPEQTLLLTDMGVIRPERTFGMDSNWILRHLMEADERPIEAVRAIRKVEERIKEGEFEKAREEIEARRRAGLDLTEWAILEARMARLEILAE
jgi:predicted ATP-binding protein involved in virulence